MANMNDEEIIEKAPSSPVATYILIVSSLAVVGATIFPILEIADVRAAMTQAERSSETPLALFTKNEITKLENDTAQLIAEALEGTEEGVPGEDSGADNAGTPNEGGL